MVVFSMIWKSTMTFPIVEKIWKNNYQLFNSRLWIYLFKYCIHFTNIFPTEYDMMGLVSCNFSGSPLNSIYYDY